MASWAEQLQRELSGRGLDVAAIPGKRRGLVAARAFFPGREVIFSQEPYASTPNKISVGSSCDHCFASGNLRKCSVCRVAWYCGSACQKEEWKLHQLECPAMVALAEDRKKMVTPTIRLMVRLVLRRKLQSEKIYMELQDWKTALTYCGLTIPDYERVYPPFHPMIGLQFYTCGKLEWLA